MKITVGICTWNRAVLLDVTLSSLACVEVPADVEWKVVVIDNNSTDDTASVVDKYRDRLPISRLFVRQQGKANAQNAMVERLTGDLVLWTDDDVLFDRGWLTAYADAARQNPDIDFFGGPITPRFLAPQPRWVRDGWREVASIFGERQLGDQPFYFERRTLPYGANFGARVELQKRFAFDPSLGRRGELLLTGEETDAMRQWLQSGYRGIWVPQAGIEHMVTGDMTTLRYLGRRSLTCGKSQKPQGRHAWLPVRTFAALWHGCRACKYQLALSRTSAKHQTAKWVRSLIKSRRCWGRVGAQCSGLLKYVCPPIVRRLQRQQEHPRVTTAIHILPLVQRPPKRRPAVSKQAA